MEDQYSFNLDKVYSVSILCFSSVYHFFDSYPDFTDYQPVFIFLFIIQANSLRQIDQYYKLPVFGYNNIDEYYAAGSPARKLRNLTTPVLCINAADDPFSPSDGNINYLDLRTLKLLFISELPILHF